MVKREIRRKRLAQASPTRSGVVERSRAEQRGEGVVKSGSLHDAEGDVAFLWVHGDQQQVKQMQQAHH